MKHRRLWSSIRCAFGGIGELLIRERNARFQAMLTGLMVVAGLLLECDTDDWLWLLLATGLVWTAEALNTAIELLGDAIAPGRHPLVGRAKDVAAGAVLMAAITALIIGGLVLGPRLVDRYYEAFPPPIPPQIPAPSSNDLSV